MANEPVLSRSGNNASFYFLRLVSPRIMRLGRSSAVRSRDFLLPFGGSKNGISDVRSFLPSSSLRSFVRPSLRHSRPFSVSPSETARTQRRRTLPRPRLEQKDASSFVFSVIQSFSQSRFWLLSDEQKPKPKQLRRSIHYFFGRWRPTSNIINRLWLSSPKIAATKSQFYKNFTSVDQDP